MKIHFNKKYANEIIELQRDHEEVTCEVIKSSYNAGLNKGLFVSGVMLVVTSVLSDTIDRIISK